MGNRLTTNWQAFEDASYEMLDLVEAGDTAGALEYYNSTLNEVSETLADSLDETGELAGQTVEAAQNTAGLINASLQSVQEGIAIANDTAEKLNGMVSQVQGIADKVKTIAEASNSQAASVKEMSANISEISSVGQNNAATSEESLALSYEMNEHADSLKGLVERFELKK